MLTQSEWKTLSAGLRVLCKTHCTPFDWLQESNLLVPTRSKTKVVTSALCLALTTSYTIFNFARLPSTYLKPDFNVADLVMHILGGMWYMTMATWQFVVGFQNRHALAAMFNQQAHFNATQGMDF